MNHINKFLCVTTRKGVKPRRANQKAELLTMMARDRSRGQKKRLPELLLEWQRLHMMLHPIIDPISECVTPLRSQKKKTARLQKTTPSKQPKKPQSSKKKGKSTALKKTKKTAMKKAMKTVKKAFRGIE